MIRLLVLIFFFAACNAPDAPSCLRRTGDTKQERRDLIQPIEQLFLNDRIDLVFVKDTSDFLIVEGGSNVIPFISTEQDGTSLTIKDDNRCKWVRSFKRQQLVYLHYTNAPKQLLQMGFGSIVSQDTLEAENLKYIINGVSSVDLKVKADYVEIDAENSSETTIIGTSIRTRLVAEDRATIQSSMLQSSFIEVVQLSERPIEISNPDSLKLSIENEGEVIYCGTPVIDTVVLRLGSLRQDSCKF